MKADIATAKNIHGIAAELIAEDPSIGNGLTAAVAKKIDGAASDATTLPNTKLNSSVSFSVDYDATTGNITVTAGNGNQVYPNQTGTYSS